MKNTTSPPRLFNPTFSEKRLAEQARHKRNYKNQQPSGVVFRRENGTVIMSHRHNGERITFTMGLTEARKSFKQLGEALGEAL